MHKSVAAVLARHAAPSPENQLLGEISGRIAMAIHALQLGFPHAKDTAIAELRKAEALIHPNPYG